MADRFMGDREIAAFLGVETRTVRRYRASGRLPTRSIGRLRGCLESELMRALGVPADGDEGCSDADAAVDQRNQSHQGDLGS